MQRYLVIVILLVSAVASGEPKMKTGACAGKTFGDCSKAALDFEYGAHGVKLDKKQAAAMYQAACDAGDLGSCTSRAQMGIHSGLDEAGIRKLYEKGCSTGDPDDCELYAYHLTDSDEAVDLAKGYAMLEKLCLAGKGGPCNVVADHANDKTEIVKWRRKSCAAKEGGDCDKLAVLLLREEDPASTPVQVTHQLETLCNAAVVNACSYAEERHFQGKGAKASRADSDVWGAKACDLGMAIACRALGRRAFYDQKDKQRAQVWFQKACDAKDTDSCDEVKRLQR